MPVMARPRIKAITLSLCYQAWGSAQEELTMNIALSLISLRNEQIRHVPANVVFITGSVSAKDLL